MFAVTPEGYRERKPFEDTVFDSLSRRLKVQPSPQSTGLEVKRRAILEAVDQPRISTQCNK